MLQERMVIGDCYILQEPVGEDSSSEFWIATAIFSATRFLLRFLKPGRIDAESAVLLGKELMRSYNIKNQFVCDVIELESFGDRFFLSYEYHDEISIGRFLESGETSTLTHLCKYALSLAQGLESFHAAQIVFGNLNDENVLMEKNGIVWSAKIRKPAMLSLLRFPVPVDSAQSCYLAPEFRLSGTLLPASDLYSLGIHVVRMVTGRLPCSLAESGTQSAPLRYVTNSLFRRGVPEPLVRIILRALLPDPACRYQSCAEFAQDMRVFLSEPDSVADARDVSFVSGGTGTLSRYIPSFDSNAYFRENSGDAEKATVESVYPVMRLTGFADADEVEREELVVSPEEKFWTIDDYIANARAVIPGIPEDIRRVNAEELKEVLHPEVTVSPPVPNPVPASAVVSMTEDAFPSIMLPSQTRLDEGTIGQVSQETGRSRNRAKKKSSRRVASPSPQGRAWSYQRIQLQDVVAIVYKAAERANEGFGSFRYIQEPESGYRNSDLFDSLESLSSTCLYVNVGSCARYGTANTDDFLRMLVKALSERLRGESRKKILPIARAVSAKDESGYFRMGPLGEILYGANGRRPKSNLANEVQRASAIKALACFSRPNRPLVIVVRGGERISRDLHDFFSMLSIETGHSRIAVVVFFERTHFAEWHTLSLLAKSDSGLRNHSANQSRSLAQ